MSCRTGHKAVFIFDETGSVATLLRITRDLTTLRFSGLSP